MKEKILYSYKNTTPHSQGNHGPLKNDDRLKVRHALIGALPDFEENKYDEMMEMIEEIISQEELVRTFSHLMRVQEAGINQRFIKMQLT